MKIIVSLTVFIVLFVVFVRYIERTGIFYPHRTLDATPQDIGIPYEDAFIQTKDNVTIHGWLIKAPSARATLIFFHGNAGNIADRLDKIDLFYKTGINVLIIDYRGYGKSQGNPTEKGIYADAAAAYDYLKARDDTKDQKIVGYGASLGGAVAIDLASNRPLHALIADSTFSSAVDMAKQIYPFIPSFLIQTKMDSVGKIKHIDIPKLFIHSIDDTTVPIVLGKKLFDAAGDPKTMVEITGDHNDGYLLNKEKIKNEISLFLKDLGLI